MGPKYWHKRRGTAVTELAICIPVLFVVIFGGIEVCNAVFLKQALTEAAYEGALVGSRARMTEADIRSRVQTSLTARNISGATVDVLAGGKGFDGSKAGKEFKVHVEAAVADNAAGPALFTALISVAADVTARKQ